MYYQSSTTLTTPIGNNALSYNERKLLGSLCSLHIPALHIGTRDDVKVGDQIVFEEVDHKDNLQQCFGLQDLVEIIPSKIPTFVIDNHNHALYLRYREHLVSRLGAGALLIHIDQHADMGIPEPQIDTAKCRDIDYISSYTNEVCNVGNFIQPALDSGLISDMIQIRSVSKLLESKPAQEEYILDVDIDFRSDHMPTKEETTAVRNLYERATICTIALSPYFMDIHKAIEVAKILFA